MTEPSLPLLGIRVVDLSQNLAGPYATMILADLGADVIKVEPPGGDPARKWGPPFVDGESPLFLCANRNKRSVVLDLTDDEDRRTLRRLAGLADVFVQAFRAGVIERLGFDEPTVRALRNDVIYASVSAYGEGPLEHQPGYDPLLQAHAGLFSVTGHPGDAPARVGTSVVDLGTGIWTALGVLAALRTRDRTGEGAHVSTALLDTSLAWMAYHLQGYLATGQVPGPLGTGLGMIAPYQAFETADGRVMIGGGNDAIFHRLCGALELEELGRDPRFATNPDRVAHRVELADALEARTRALSTADLVDRLQGASVPCAPIHDVGEVVRDPQVRATGMLRGAPPSVRWPLSGWYDGPGTSPQASESRGAPDRGVAGYVDVAIPPRWDGARAPVRRPPPAVGEHTEEVLAELEGPED
jgi:crotonobetainyl-CoA:carnitine CoA-transferase CaiB-like acyl-CoA transferase